MKRLNKRIVLNTLAVILLAVLLIAVICSEGQEPSVDWSGLETRREETEDGTIRFSVSLSEEQAANYKQGALFILEQGYSKKGGLENSYELLWETTDLMPDEDHMLSADYSNRAIYVLSDSTGEKLCGPVGTIRRKNGGLAAIVRYSDKQGIFDDDLLDTVYLFHLDENAQTIAVASTLAWNEDSESYSGAVSLDEDYFRSTDYTKTSFYSDGRLPPSEEDSLPGFDAWKQDAILSGFEVQQLTGWHFEAAECGTERERIFVSFQIEDKQGRTHSSTPCPVFPDLVQVYDVVPSLETIDGEPLSAAAHAQYYLEEGFVNFQIRFLDVPEQVESFSAEDDSIFLNDTILVDSSWLTGFSDDGIMMLSLREEALRGLPDVSSLSFDLTIKQTGAGALGHYHVRLELPVPIPLDLTDAKPLAAATTEDGLEWTIWEVQPQEDGSVVVNYSVFNGTKAPKEIEIKNLSIAGYAAKTYASSFPLMPGVTAIGTVKVDPSVSGGDSSFMPIASVDNPLALIGVKDIREIYLFYTEDRFGTGDLAEIRLAWEEPVPYTPQPPAEGLQQRELINTGETRICLYQRIPFHDSQFDRDAILIGLLVFNDSDETHNYLFERFVVNGIHVRNDSWRKTNEFLVAPHGVQYCYLQVELPPGVTHPDEMMFDVFVDEACLQKIPVDLNSLA